MAGKKSGKALEKEGLQRTDNGMPLTSMAAPPMINQKNYYTDFLKHDDQILATRLQTEDARNRMAKAARDKDRALAQPTNGAANGDDDTVVQDAATNGDSQDTPDVDDSKVIVIHPGSQNLRVGLATDALPKTVPMVIARRNVRAEYEEHDGEPLPKRMRLDNTEANPPETWFGDDFAREYQTMAAEFKTARRVNKRRVLPNSRDLVVKWNAQTPPEKISEHNDQLRVDWTEVDKTSPERITGHAALRIPDTSQPRYRLSRPWQHGWLNEADYSSRRLLLQDFFCIIEDAIVNQLNIHRKSDLKQYSCVFVVPDLYEKVVVSEILGELLRDLGFLRVAFIQESLAATFGAGYSSSCIVDVGAQKTSICCVEEGMCLENTRMNLQQGGEDITRTFIKMMIFDHFNYSDMNLNRRYDYLLAEELKHKFCTLSDDNISVQQYDFYLRAFGQETRKYQFKMYDEGMLAAMGLYRPIIYDHSYKLKGRRKFIDRSKDTYDGKANDPITPVQLQALQYASEHVPSAMASVSEPAPSTSAPAPVPATSDTSAPMQTPARASGLGHISHLIEDGDANSNASAAGSPAPPDSQSTPQPGATNGATNGTTNTITNTDDQEDETQNSTTELQDETIPVMPLDLAILACITEGAKGDERRLRDFLGGIMVIGGGSKLFHFNAYLEDRLRAQRPDLAKDILIGPPPRELDPAVLVWKGASVFGKLDATNECWIGRLEYDRLGARILNYKCMWHW